MTTLAGKTFVSAVGNGRSQEEKAVVKSRHYVDAKGPVSAAAMAEAERAQRAELLRAQTAAKSFTPPQGHFDWGQRLYGAGLGIDVCTNDKMRMGWLTAARQG